MRGILFALVLFISICVALIALAVWWAGRRWMRQQEQRAALDARGIKELRDDEWIDPMKGPP